MADSAVEQYLANYDGLQRAALETTCATIRGALPGATDSISYGMPTFKVDGVAVVGVAGFRQHNSLFPYSGSVLAMIGDTMPGWVASKGTVHFPAESAFPAPLLKRVLRARMAEINDSYPRKNGESKSFYPNGFLKAKGRTRNGKAHGSWVWFRRDGSRLRSGSFRDGVKTGEWTTFDDTGTPVKVTRVRTT